MSFVNATPEYVAAAASDLANIGSTISSANSAAVGPTSSVSAAGADSVSAAIAQLFGAHAQAYQAISAQAKYFRTKKLHNTGTTKVLWAQRTIASNGVIVSACYDTSAARTVNSRGHSVLPNTTPTRWLDQMRVLPQQSRWIVDGGTTTPNAC